MNIVPVLGSTIGQIFQPLFQAMAWLIALFYAVVPNYAIAIAMLTIVVMIVTAPLTVKSTRSMSAMQRLAPELKKLQQKYKGDKQTLNEEMMKLYKEHGVNPAGGCLPMLIQFPIFIILYDVIRGLTNTVKRNSYISVSPRIQCHQAVCAAPRYIGHSTKLYESLLAHNGKMPAFGIDLAAKALSHHSFVQALPYISLILVAIGLQYFQMRQLNSRNPQMAQANPQAQMMQRYMPILFAVIYINIAAGVNIYFIVSSLCRIGIQEAVFRSGMLSKPAAAASEEVLPGRRATAGPRRKRTLMERLADAQKRALEQQAQQQSRRSEIEAETGIRPDSKPLKGPSASATPKSTTKKDPSASVQKQGSGERRQAPAGRPDDGSQPDQAAPSNGDGKSRASTNGAPSTPNGSPAKSNGSPAKNGDPSRSRNKRDRRTR